MSTPEMQRFGQKLRTLRQRHGLSTRELAQAVGHSASGYISELETGKKKPTSEMVIKLARLFNVTTDQLLLDETELHDVQDA